MPSADQSLPSHDADGKWKTIRDQNIIGRELGTYGLDAYLETKQININTAPQRLGWFKNLSS